MKFLWMPAVKNLTAEDRKELNRLQRDAIKNLNLYWFKEMVTSSAQLREKWLSSGMAILPVGITMCITISYCFRFFESMVWVA